MVVCIVCKYLASLTKYSFLAFSVIWLKFVCWAKAEQQMNAIANVMIVFISVESFVFR